jgi:transposase
MGLNPILRRSWALKGQGPIAIQKRAYQWLHAYAFVQPDSGRNEFWIASYIDTVTMNVMLQQFTQTVNPDQKKLIRLLWDNAAWHRAKDLEVPADIILFPIPPYSSELSPAEAIVPLLHEAMANQFLTTLQALQNRLEQRCLFLQQHWSVVKAACGFAWASLHMSLG